MLISPIVTNLRKLPLLIAAVALSITAYAQGTLNLTAGWNLLGNSGTVPIEVEATFGDASKILAVWKWNKTAEKWAFYAPSMSPSTLAAYVQARGYDKLISVASKEGFWVNASTPIAVTSPVQNALKLTESDLQLGWNLVSSADNQSPSQLNQELSSNLIAAGKSMVSAWAWDATSSKWKFYSPSLEAQGGTALNDYISSRGYLPFVNLLSPADGYWMNVQAKTIDTSPIELLIAGQSNAVSDANGAAPLYSTTGRVYINDFYCEYATGKHECRGGMDMVVPTQGHALTSSQAWILLGDELHKLTGRDVYIYNLARGGQSTDFFIKKDSGWLDMFKSFLATKPKTCAILWIQGESEQGFATQETYDNMRVMIDTSRAIHPSLPWYVALDSWARAAQQRLINDRVASQGADIDLLRTTPSYFDSSQVEFIGNGQLPHALAWLTILQQPIIQGMCPR